MSSNTISIEWEWAHLASDSKPGSQGKGWYLGDSIHWKLSNFNIKSNAQLIQIGNEQVENWDFKAINTLLDQFLRDDDGPEHRILVFRNNPSSTNNNNNNNNSHNPSHQPQTNNNSNQYQNNNNNNNSNNYRNNVHESSSDIRNMNTSSNNNYNQQNNNNNNNNNNNSYRNNNYSPNKQYNNYGNNENRDRNQYSQRNKYPYDNNNNNSGYGGVSGYNNNRDNNNNNNNSRDNGYNKYGNSYNRNDYSNNNRYRDNRNGGYRGGGNSYRGSSGGGYRGGRRNYRGGGGGYQSHRSYHSYNSHKPSYSSYREYNRENDNMSHKSHQSHDNNNEKDIINNVLQQILDQLSYPAKSVYNPRDIIWAQVNNEYYIAVIKFVLSDGYIIRPFGKPEQKEIHITKHQICNKPTGQISTYEMKQIIDSIQYEISNLLNMRAPQLYYNTLIKYNDNVFGNIMCKNDNGTYDIKIHSDCSWNTGNNVITEIPRHQIAVANEYELKYCAEIYSNKSSELEREEFDSDDMNEMCVYWLLDEVGNYYIREFINNGFTSISFLLLITEQDLVSMNIKLAHRRYILHQIKSYNEDEFDNICKEKQMERDMKNKIREEEEKKNSINEQNKIDDIIQEPINNMNGSVNIPPEPTNNEQIDIAIMQEMQRNTYASTASSEESSESKSEDELLGNEETIGGPNDMNMEQSEETGYIRDMEETEDNTIEEKIDKKMKIEIESGRDTGYEHDIEDYNENDTGIVSDSVNNTNIVDDIKVIEVNKVSVLPVVPVNDPLEIAEETGYEDEDDGFDNKGNNVNVRVVMDDVIAEETGYEDDLDNDDEEKKGDVNTKDLDIEEVEESDSVSDNGNVMKVRGDGTDEDESSASLLVEDVTPKMDEEVKVDAMDEKDKDKEEEVVVDGNEEVVDDEVVIRDECDDKGKDNVNENDKEIAEEDVDDGLGKVDNENENDNKELDLNDNEIDNENDHEL